MTCSPTDPLKIAYFLDLIIKLSNMHNLDPEVAEKVFYTVV